MNAQRQRQPAPPASIRMAVEDDLDRIMPVEHRAYPFPWSRQVFRDCLRAHYPTLLLHEADGRLLGHAVLNFAADECHLLNIAIDPAAQGRGLGRQLLDAALALAITRRAQRMFLEVRPSNTHAITLYDRVGFNEIGRRPRYYPAHDGRREDAIVMAMELLQ